VWYFLTGSLAKAANLRSLLRLDQDPDLRIATVEDVCHIKLGKFNALTESYRDPMWTSTEETQGVAYPVKNEKEEQAMRLFKTDFFAALRCKIKLRSPDGHGYESEINGLTLILLGSWPTLQKMALPSISMYSGAVGSKRAAQFNCVPIDEKKKGRASSITHSAYETKALADDNKSRSLSLKRRPSI
jgi:hypothetical protein